MILNIRVQNFRSYSNDGFEFSPKVNIMVGPNGCGKTNLLEAILVVCSGSSYRAKDLDLIKFNESWSRIDAASSMHDRTVKIQADHLPPKTIDVDGKIYKRLPTSQKIPIVLFEPNHLQLLNGSPDGRRAYLDDFLSQTELEYQNNLRKYLRALSQRNALLKNIQSKRAPVEQLFPWNLRLSQLAGQIVRSRSSLVEDLNGRIGDVYNLLSEVKTNISIEYKSQLKPDIYESGYLSKLEQNLNVDILSGHTNIGPHRDDFVILYNKVPSGLIASRGETRSGVLALKIIELETIEKITSQKPIFLLDDVFSELDGYRRKALADTLNNGQSFITTTDADIVLRQLKGKHNIIPLSRVDNEVS